MAKITAIIDIGSNSARMAIFERTSRLGFHLIYEAKSRVRISEKTYENNGYLQEMPMERALDALGDFLEIAKRYKAKKVLCVATSAVRDAPNRSIFVSKARKIGLNIRVISGEQEAYFGALGAVNLLHEKSGITIDIGGGSTECALCENGKIKERVSLKLGTIRLKELFLDRGDFIGAREFILSALKTLPQSFSCGVVFGIGGTARALSSAIQAKIDYPMDILHGFMYEFSEYSEFLGEICEAKPARLGEMGIKPERFDSINGGALIFTEALRHFGAQKVITSGAGVREGVFLADLLRHFGSRFPNDFNPSVRNLRDRFVRDVARAKNAKNIARKIFEAQSALNLISKEFEKHLEIAAELCDIGAWIDFYERHWHTSYILLNGLNYCLSHEDRAILATLARYSNRKIPQEQALREHKILLPGVEILQFLSCFLSVADICSQNPNPREFSFKFTKNSKIDSIENENLIAQKSSEKITLKISHPRICRICKEMLQKLILPSDLEIVL